MPWNIAPSSLTRFPFLPFLLTWDVSWEVFSHPTFHFVLWIFPSVGCNIPKDKEHILYLCNPALGPVQCLKHNRRSILGCLTNWMDYIRGQCTAYKFLKHHFPVQLTSKMTFILQKRGTSKRPKALTPCGTIRCMLTNWNSCFIYKINPRRYLMTSLIFAFYHLACLLLCNAETHGQHWLGSFWLRSCSKTCTHYSLTFSLHILKVSFWGKIKLKFYFDAVKKHFNLFFQNTMFLGLLVGSVS